MANYEKRAVNDRHVQNLRHYGTSVRDTQFQVAALSSKRDGLSAMKDFFVEGQVSIRSPKMRQQIGATHLAQRSSVERLSVPRQSREHFIDTVNTATGTPHKSDYLRSSHELNFTPIRKGGSLSSSAGLQMAL